LVVGGLNEASSEIFDFDDNSWISGPSVEAVSQLYYSTSIPYENSFLVVGGYDGYDGESNLDTIFYFDATAMEWTTLTRRLKTGRSASTGFMVPQSALNCS
jgi:N-acetylneuraminic acid mutarotase